MLKLVARDIVNNFKYKILVGEKYLDREINVYGLNRPGLELSGFNPKINNDKRRVVLFSYKEFLYISTLDKLTRKSRYELIINNNIPLIILTDKFDDDLLLEVAENNKCPVVRAENVTTSNIYRLLFEFFDKYFSPVKEEHASLINVFGKGVLLKGESGIGKSELTLELIKKNHLFIGDDRILIMKRNNKLYGKSHEILKNLIEVRGIGILDLSKIYGLQVLLNETKIDMIIELVNQSNIKYKAIDRFNYDYKYVEIFDILIPIVIIPVTCGRNISELVEIAVSKLKLEESGFSLTKDLQRKIKLNLSK